MEENKKVKNATKIEYDNIKFRSILEKDCYILLKEGGLEFEYEKHKFVLCEGFYPPNSLLIYDVFKPRKQKRIFGLNTQKIIDMTYTPDFYLFYKGYDIYIESKGNPNDTYPLKKKLFLSFLAKEAAKGKKVIFFEPHSKRQMKEVIKLIKEL